MHCAVNPLHPVCFGVYLLTHPIVDSIFFIACNGIIMGKKVEMTSMRDTILVRFISTSRYSGTSVDSNSYYALVVYLFTFIQASNGNKQVS